MGRRGGNGKARIVAVAIVSVPANGVVAECMLGGSGVGRGYGGGGSGGQRQWRKVSSSGAAAWPARSAA